MSRPAETDAPQRRVRALVGEEIGLVGSNAFVTKPPIPIDQIAAYLNFDMVGRMQNNKLAAAGTGSSAGVAAHSRARERRRRIRSEPPNADPYQPTDVANFNQAGLPSLFFTTGSHPDYHKPSDTADKIDYEDLDRIVDFAAAITEAVANTDMAPQFTKVDQPQTGATLAGVRVTTGTIPDYTTEAKGLLLARRRRRRSGGTGRSDEGRRHRRDRRPVDHEYLRLHVRARTAEG